MLATTTDNYMAHHNLGFVLLKEDRLEAAAWHFKRAIAIAPEFEPAVASLGTIAKKRGRHAEAVRWYKNAMAINPHYSVAYLNLGNLYFDRGEFHEAIRYFSKGIKVEPLSSLLYNSLGAALTKTGRLEEAVICYRKALQIDPGLKIAAMNLDAVEAAFTSVRLVGLDLLLTAAILAISRVFPGRGMPLGPMKALGIGDALPIVRGARRRRDHWPDRETARVGYLEKRMFRWWDLEVFDDGGRRFLDASGGAVEAVLVYRDAGLDVTMQVDKLDSFDELFGIDLPPFGPFGLKASSCTLSQISVQLGMS